MGDLEKGLKPLEIIAVDLSEQPVLHNALLVKGRSAKELSGIGA